jgi:hypothetical protein
MEEFVFGSPTSTHLFTPLQTSRLSQHSLYIPTSSTYQGVIEDSGERKSLSSSPFADGAPGVREGASIFSYCRVLQHKIFEHTVTTFDKAWRLDTCPSLGPTPKSGFASTRLLVTVNF